MKQSGWERDAALPGFIPGVWHRVCLWACLIFFAAALTLRAEEPRKYTFRSPTLQGIFREISHQFGVTVIADPALDGGVPKEVQGNTVGSVLQAVLNPLGYSYTKVDNYYIVSGPESPLTLLAESESAVVPVGVLQRGMQDQLGELRKYLQYDAAAGLVYIKAPSSQMNRILEKLWAISQTSRELSVLYQLQIIDLGSSSNLDFLFSGKYDGSSAQNTLLLTPEQWVAEGKAQLTLRAKAAESSAQLVRQPWFIVAPGKTAALTVGLQFFGKNIQYESHFKVALTPTGIDPGAGKVVSKVLIEQDTVSRDMKVASLSQPATQIADKVNKVATELETRAGKGEIAALMRQTFSKDGRSQVLPLFGARNKNQERRDYLFMLKATPLNVQSIMATTNGVLPVASLAEKKEPETAGKVERKNRAGLGIAGSGNSSLSPRLELKYSLDAKRDLWLQYHSENQYAAGAAYNIDQFASFRILAGQGIGPQGRDALMIGVVDRTAIAPYLQLFGKWYPVSYLFDSGELSWRSVWEAGFRVGEQDYGLSISAGGDSQNIGSRFELDYATSDHTWVLGYDTLRGTDYSFGVWLNF